jgi:hypothetical protein
MRHFKLTLEFQDGTITALGMSHETHNLNEAEASIQKLVQDKAAGFDNVKNFTIIQISEEGQELQ